MAERIVIQGLRSRIRELKKTVAKLQRDCSAHSRRHSAIHPNCTDRCDRSESRSMSRDRGSAVAPRSSDQQVSLAGVTFGGENSVTARTRPRRTTTVIGGCLESIPLVNAETSSSQPILDTALPIVSTNFGSLERGEGISGTGGTNAASARPSAVRRLLGNQVFGTTLPIVAADSGGQDQGEGVGMETTNVASARPAVARRRPRNQARIVSPRAMGPPPSPPPVDFPPPLAVAVLSVDVVPAGADMSIVIEALNRVVVAVERLTARVTSLEGGSE